MKSKRINKKNTSEKKLILKDPIKKYAKKKNRFQVIKKFEGTIKKQKGKDANNNKKKT